MLAILNSLNARNLPIFQRILMILVSKFMVHRVLSDKIYLLLELLSPLSPPVKYFTYRSKAVLLLWILYIFLSYVCYVFVRVCLYVLCDHLLGKG